MAIYHFTAKIVSRAKGQSVVASAAYRAGQALADDRYGLTHDYINKKGIGHSEILAPETAPAWVLDRQRLWNEVEASEKRKDAQLARELEIALPIELTNEEQVTLARDYVRRNFVSKGMIADFNIHRDDPGNPHMHILLTMRRISEDGFGRKERSWNAKSGLLEWRAQWAEMSNEHLARAGHAVRIDHRTFEAQGIELTPGRKIGIGRDRHGEPTLPPHVVDRIAESRRIARENGALIIEDPTVALHALTHQRATFTHHDIARFLHTRTDGADQFDQAYLKVTTAKEIVPLGVDERHRMRFTTRDMLEAEKSLLNRSTSMAKRPGHGVAPHRQASVLTPSTLSPEQRAAFEHVTAKGDVKAVVGVAGSGKSTLLAAARQAWEAEGLTVKGTALSGIAAENLQAASGIRSRTLASYEYAWKEGRDPLTQDDVLVIDEAGMIGTKQLERMLAAADKARAKVVLVGDPEQLQAIEAGAPFRGIVGEVGMMELTQVRRQKQPWAREATQALAAGKTPDALAAYEEHGAIVQTTTKLEAHQRLLAEWSADAARASAESRLILAYTRDDVRELNAEARKIRESRRELGRSHTIGTTRGDREFASNDRIVFLRNEKSLGVKNGSLGTIEAIDHGVLQVRLDDRDQTQVIVDTRDYQDLDYGYATTVHKSQGSTVDRAYVLASRYFDRHTSYVALSRHRQAAKVFYAQEDFAAGGGMGVGKGGVEQGGALDAAAAREKFHATLSRARPKELAHDYLDRDVFDQDQAPPIPGAVDPHWSPAPEPSQAPATQPLTPDEIQAAARERWAAYRAKIESGHDASADSAVRDAARRDREADLGRENDLGQEYPDDDFSL
jgi:Ti-type conjugative transfer relaxase TraA